MNHLFSLSSLTNPPSLIQQSVNMRSNLMQEQLYSSGNQLPRQFSERQLLSALIQINKMLEHDLSIELQKNKILLQILCSDKKLQIKHQQLDNEMVMHKQAVSQQQNSVQQEKKLTTNDTKNISKNFGKAIITFIQKNPQKVNCILQDYKIDIQKFSNQLKQRKKKLISIKQLRSLWLESQFEFAKPFREISYLFLRKASFKYIFGSRIADYAGHLKYRRRMIEALQCPEAFTSIKQ